MPGRTDKPDQHDGPVVATLLPYRDRNMRLHLPIKFHPSDICRYDAKIQLSNGPQTNLISNES